MKSLYLCIIFSFLISLLLSPVVLSWDYSLTENSIQTPLDATHPEVGNGDHLLSRDMIYTHNKFWFTPRPDIGGSYQLGVINCTDVYTEASCSDFNIIYNVGDADTDYGSAWETLWYNPYEEEIWVFMSVYDYDSYSDGQNAYIKKYNFTTNVWSNLEVWKQTPEVNGKRRLIGFNYAPVNVTLDNGDTRWVIPVSLKNYTQGSGDEFLCDCAVYYSDDNGNTWTLSDIVPDKPVLDIEENSVVQLANGSLVMNFRYAKRSDSNAYYMWRTFSYDYGETWTSPEKVNNIQISVAKTLLRKIELYDMPVYVFQGNNRPEGYSSYGWCTADKRANLSLWFSSDGVTWDDKPNVIYPSTFGEGQNGVRGQNVAYGSLLAHNNSFYLCSYSTDLSGTCEDTYQWNIFKVNIDVDVTITNETISDYATDVSSNSFSVDLQNRSGGSFDYTIECSSGDTKTGTGESNGTKTLSLDLIEDNSSYIIWVNSSDAFFNRTFHFDTGEPFGFQSINNQKNNTATTEVFSSFNWTKDDDAEYYQLQIANDSGFSDVFVNLTNVNESNYGVNYTETGNYVEFTLPDSYRKSWYGEYYFRVRPWSYYNG